MHENTAHAMVEGYFGLIDTVYELSRLSHEARDTAYEQLRQLTGKFEEMHAYSPELRVEIEALLERVQGRMMTIQRDARENPSTPTEVNYDLARRLG